MPDPSVITPGGRALLDQLPPALRGSIDYMALLHCAGREAERLEAAVEAVRAQFNPATADLLLGAWETQLKLPVGGGGADVTTRRSRILARLQRVLNTGAGFEWEQILTGMIGPGWSYAEHDPADLGSPPEGTVRVTLPYALTDPQFTALQPPIIEVTDAHIVLEFATSVVFRLDISELDVDEFGT